MAEEKNLLISRAAHWALIAGILVVFLLPTLGWRDFTDGMENFNVLTAIECARDGHWLIPTSNGLPRLQKPPLTSWLTAGGLLIGGQLEFAARWPTLVIAWILLIAVYESARLLRDERLGLEAAIICATTIFFLRYSRRASYDMQLAAWVALCNYFVLRVIVRGEWIVGCIAAGVALGLAQMTKGPVAFTWTVGPLVVWLIIERIIAKRGSFTGKQWLSIGLGIFATLLISLPWVIYVLTAAGNQLALWTNEVRLEDEGMERTRSYFGEGLVCLAQLMPWTPLMFVGMAGLRRGISGVPANIIRLMLCTVVLPLIIVSCVPPVRDRYLLPMIAPAAILAAAGLAAFRGANWIKPATWVLAGIMLIVNLGLSWRDRQVQSSYSTIKNDARSLVNRWPTAHAYSLTNEVPPRGLSIYLNRSIVQVDKLEDIPAPTGPQLLMLRDFRKGEHAPQGWTLNTQLKNGSVEWLVYERGGERTGENNSLQ
jgi:4-amino-4-deoxy-L-arabinose transferase-like glycosyltransferase